MAEHSNHYFRRRFTALYIGVVLLIGGAECFVHISDFAKDLLSDFKALMLVFVAIGTMDVI